MLLVWLFALATSIAQACIAQSPHSAASHGEHCAETLLPFAPDTAELQPSGDESPAWKAACSKFCSETTFPTQKVKSTLSDGDGPQPLHVPVAAAHWSSARTSSPTPSGAFGPQSGGHVRPPIPIVFLRLAL